jgi:ribonuclease P protein component
LRHLVRERLADLPDASVLVVRALPAAADATYDELREDLGRCLQRVLSTPTRLAPRRADTVEPVSPS